MLAFVLTCAAGAHAQETAPTPFDPSACAGRSHGKMFVALFRVVFALPVAREIGGSRNYPGAFTASREHPAMAWTEFYAPRPAPPDAREHEGCFRNPAQRYSYGFDGQTLEALIGSSATPKLSTSQNIDDTAYVEVMQDEAAGTVLPPAHPPRDALGHIIPPPPASSVYIGGGGPNQVPLTVGAPCTTPMDLLHLTPTALACDCRADGGYDSAAGLLDVPIAFRCGTMCEVREIFQPGVFLSFQHAFDVTSHLSVCRQMIAYRRDLHAALHRAEVTHYRWRS